MKRVMLNNQLEIPTIGFCPGGTAPPDAIEELIHFAIRLGYRLFDITGSSTPPQSIWNAIKKSGVPRQQIFIAVGFSTLNVDFESAKEVLNLWIDELDLGFIDILVMDYQRLENSPGKWKFLKAFQQWSRVRAIALQGLDINYLNEIDANHFKPALCKMDGEHYGSPSAGMLAESNSGKVRQLKYYNPLSLADASVSAAIREIAVTHRKTIDQVVLRWYIQKGEVAIVRSAHKEDLITNISIFDFTLSFQEMQLMAEHL